MMIYVYIYQGVYVLLTEVCVIGLITTVPHVLTTELSNNSCSKAMSAQRGGQPLRKLTNQMVEPSQPLPSNSCRPVQYNNSSQQSSRVN